MIHPLVSKCQVVVIFNFWTFTGELNIYNESVYNRIIGGNIINYLLLYQVFIILMLILMRSYARHLYVCTYTLCMC